MKSTLASGRDRSDARRKPSSKAPAADLREKLVLRYQVGVLLLGPEMLAEPHRMGALEI